MGTILFFILMGMLMHLISAVLMSLHKPVDQTPMEKHCPPHQWSYVQNHYGETRVECGRCSLTIGDSGNDNEAL